MGGQTNGPKLPTAGATGNPEKQDNHSKDISSILSFNKAQINNLYTSATSNVDA